MQVNYYRIVRLMGWEGQYFDTLVLVMHAVGFVVATIALYMLTYKWIVHRRFVYWTTIFWMPYTAFFIFIFVNVYPITYRGGYASPSSRVRSFCDALVLSVLYRNFEYYMLSFKI